MNAGSASRPTSSRRRTRRPGSASCAVTETRSCARWITGRTSPRRPSIDELLELKPGANTIELEAVNEGARDDLREQETERFGPLTVRYHPRPVEPPIIKIESLIALAGEGRRRVRHDQGQGERALHRRDDSPRPCSRPDHRQGQAQTPGVAVGRDDDWKALSGVDGGCEDSFDIKEELELSPDRQIICFRAQAGNDESLEATSAPDPDHRVSSQSPGSASSSRRNHPARSSSSGPEEASWNPSV